KVRDAAARSSCGNNMHQIAIAVHDYHGVWGRFPINYAYSYDASSPSWSWLAHLLPMLEQDALFGELGVLETPASPFIFNGQPVQGRPIDQSQAAIAIPVDVFRCPADGYGRGGPVVQPSNYTMGSPTFGPLAYSPGNYKANMGSNWGGGAPGGPYWWG